MHYLSANTKAQFTINEWSEIIGMRNVFKPEYVGIDSNFVSEIIKK